MLSKETRASVTSTFRDWAPVGTTARYSEGPKLALWPRYHSAATLALPQRYPRLVAQLMSRLVDGEPVVRAVEQHAEARHHGMLASRRLGEAFCKKRSAVQEPVGNVNAWHPRAQLIGDLSQELTCVGQLSSVML